MPTSTYRLQLHGAFGLAEAQAVASYLADLGITDCYCSPVFTAMPGSTHGYDICSHGEINAELGGEAAFDAFAAELGRLGMGLILDFVPNHMSNDARTNEWWRDVLENGPSSRFASFFDIDWEPVKPELKDRLLLPILGEQYGEALERGGLALGLHRGALVLGYGGHEIPINPRRSPFVFERDLERLQARLGPDDPHLREFLSVLTALRNLPAYTERDEDKVAERSREKEVARERLTRLVDQCQAIRDHLAAAVTRFNGTPGDPASFDGLHELLEMQPYRLASWKTASDEINYRRFFDVNELAGLRVEDPQVFGEVHRLVLRLVGAGQVTGLRIDHIDGLFDPAKYLTELRQAVGGDERPFYLVVEKILSAGETLRDNWPVDGTTGYNFLNDLNGLFVDGEHMESLQRIYARFTGRRQPFAEVAYESKRLIVSSALSSEFQVLTQAVNRLSERDRRSRDFTLGSIRRALREVVACCSVYRTYVSESGAAPSDHTVVTAAIDDARQRNPAMESSVFDFLRSVLLPDTAADWGQTPASRTARRRLSVAMKFQQYTAPVQAKGVEDTAFYRHHVLTSLNEVGGDPGRIGRTTDEFHAANAERRRRWPLEMLATGTHDTKRSEDARARLNVLSEMPDEWQRAVGRWLKLNAAGRTPLPGGPAPDANDEYLFYQTLVSAWPADALDNESLERAPADLVQRLDAYMRKAIREAKTHTSWITENRPYELGVARFVERTLAGAGAPGFLAAFVPFLRMVVVHGMVNSLAQLVLKMASPGVPDCYQGTELWDFSLVDPDNRRTVDFALRRRLLDDLEPLLTHTSIDRAPSSARPELTAAVTDMLRTWPDGRIKLFVTACALRLRRSRPALFLEGGYKPLNTVGRFARHAVAFARPHGSDVLLAVVPRLTSRLRRGRSALPLGPDTWADTRVRLPEPFSRRRYRNLVTGEAVPVWALKSGGGALPVAAAFETSPVALLWAEP